MTEDPFVTHRGLLFTVAYEMLGSAVDAEDVVQETWIRWDAVGRRHESRSSTRARTWSGWSPARRSTGCGRTRGRREEYVGEWLPEPLLTEPGRRRGRRAGRERVDRDAHGARDARRRPSARCSSCARCSTCRTARSRTRSTSPPAAVRQIAHRAREHVAARRPRMRVSRTEQQQVVERFLAAVTGRDLQGLLDALAPDVVLVADGGGIAQAIVSPSPARRRSRTCCAPSRSSEAAPRSCRRRSTARPAP